MIGIELRLLRKVSGLSDKTKKALHDQLEANARLADKQNPALAAQLRNLQNLRDYVDNDLPRDVHLTDEIMRCTVGFALADPNGNVLPDAQWKCKPGDKESHKLAITAAENARRSAKISFGVQVDMSPAAEPAPEPEKITSGPPSQRRA